MKISVITVCLNAEDTIGAAIESVRAQTYRDIEYIVVDGGSTDTTLEIIGRHRDVIDRYVSEPDRGIYDAINKGIKLSTGDVIGILNADDIYAPLALEYAAEYLNGGADYVFGAVKVGDRILARFNRRRAWYKNGFATKHSVGFFVRRSCHETLGLYNVKYRIAADLDFFYRLLRSPFVGVGGDGSKLFGEFGTAGLSSQDWFENFWEDILIRYNYGQPRLLLFILINLRLIYNFRTFVRGKAAIADRTQNLESIKTH